jgi:hypothetical protein
MVLGKCGVPLPIEQSLITFLRKEVVPVWAETRDFQMQDVYSVVTWKKL